MNKYVIGDIHGNYRALRQCLERVQFNYDKDILISLGDLCDRNTETREVFNELLKIKNFKMVIGNHDQWMIEWVRESYRPHTYRSYKTVLKVFFEYVREQTSAKYLKDIKPMLLEDYKRHRLGTTKTNTLKNHIICIKALLNKAVQWGYLEKSPAKYWNPVEITDAKPIRVLSEEEYRRFMDVCRIDFSKYYPMFYTFIHTGMRKSELLSLEWGDIDLQKGLVFVSSKKDFSPKGIDQKSGKAKERIIPIHDGVIKVIKTIPRKGTKVFDQHKRPRRILLRIARKSGIEGLTRLHELRHSYASFLLKKGVDIYKIKELLGHSDIRDTMKYAHLPTVHMKDDVKLLIDLDKEIKRKK